MAGVQRVLDLTAIGTKAHLLFNALCSAAFCSPGLISELARIPKTRFATHSFENGCDIRRIQKALGHVSLETTTIYVRLAQTESGNLPSPLDALPTEMPKGREMQNGPVKQKESKLPPRHTVGSMRIHFRPEYDANGTLAFSRVTLEVRNTKRPIYFTGIRAWLARAHYVTLTIPPEEQWQASLRSLTSEQRKRFGTADFYHELQNHIAERYSHLPVRRIQ